ncbi:MAG: tetratricopeptide repeat protein [Magnetococcales bacterium]|nr:tetratricopeptide repeat protein [Magnetococcales bacterium]
MHKFFLAFYGTLFLFAAALPTASLATAETLQLKLSDHLGRYTKFKREKPPQQKNQVRKTQPFFNEPKNPYDNSDFYKTLASERLANAPKYRIKNGVQKPIDKAAKATLPEQTPKIQTKPLPAVVKSEQEEGKSEKNNIEVQPNTNGNFYKALVSIRFLLMVAGVVLLFYILFVKPKKTGSNSAKVKSVKNDVEALEAVKKGIDYHQSGKFNDAIFWYKKSLKLNPENAAALNNLGATLQYKGKLDDAVANFQKAITINPELAQAHSNLGNVLSEQGRVDEAVASYKKAIEIIPDFAEAYSNLSNLLKEQGELDAAIINAHKAIDIKPDYTQAHINLGNAIAEQGHHNEAVSSYQKAISFSPDNTLAHYNLGNSLKALGDIDGAVASFHKVIAIDPDFAEAHDQLKDIIREQSMPDATAIDSPNLKI